MTTSVILDSRDHEHFLITVEDSLKVNKRFQFFLWAQGALQAFLPHETLICVHGDIQGLRFKHEVFSRGLVDEAGIERLCDPVDGLLPRVIGDWQRNGCAPLLLAKAEREGEAHPLGLRLEEEGHGHALAHGAKEARGEFGSFFLLTRLPEPPGRRHGHLVKILMPYLHMALHRMLAAEEDEAGSEFLPNAVLSEREIEVLQWVREGKTNHEIGMILNISPLTVKNHVQRILRKLKVSNRAQAVAKGVASRLITNFDAV